MQQPADSFCKAIPPGQHRLEDPCADSAPFARVVQQKRHDVENVASAGANPAASTILRTSLCSGLRMAGQSYWACSVVQPEENWPSVAQSEGGALPSVAGSAKAGLPSVAGSAKEGAEATVDRHRTFNPVW